MDEGGKTRLQDVPKIVVCDHPALNIKSPLPHTKRAAFAITTRTDTS